MRVGNLFLINVISLYVAVHLSTLVDALKMFLSTLYHVHDLVRLMIEALAIAHVDLNAKLRMNDLINLSI